MPERTIKECFDGLESQRKGFNKIVQSLDKKIEALDVRVEKMGALHDDHICKAYNQFEKLVKLDGMMQSHLSFHEARCSCYNTLAPEPDIERLAEVAHDGHYPNPRIRWKTANEDYKENTRNSVRAILKELGRDVPPCPRCGGPRHPEVDHSVMSHGKRYLFCYDCNEMTLLIKEKVTVQDPDQAAGDFIGYIHNIIDYWEGQGRGMRRTMEGLVHTLLATIDGEDADLPPYSLKPMVSPDGDDWLDIGPDIHGDLHHRFYAVKEARNPPPAEKEASDPICKIYREKGVIMLENSIVYGVEFKDEGKLIVLGPQSVLHNVKITADATIIRRDKLPAEVPKEVRCPTCTNTDIQQDPVLPSRWYCSKCTASWLKEALIPILLTRREMDALEKIIGNWVADGFISEPFPDEYHSLFNKLEYKSTERCEWRCPSCMAINKGSEPYPWVKCPNCGARYGKQKPPAEGHGVPYLDTHLWVDMKCPYCEDEWRGLPVNKCIKCGASMDGPVEDTCGHGDATPYTQRKIDGIWVIFEWWCLECENVVTERKVEKATIEDAEEDKEEE